MMKKILFLCLVLVGLLLGSHQIVSAQKRIVASKHHITRTIEVGSFDHILLNGSSDIIFTPTKGRQKLDLTLPDNLVDIVQVYVKDRTLVLEMKSHTSVMLRNGSRVELRVSAPMVEGVTLNGSGDISFSSHADSQKPFDLVINGSGDIDTQHIKATSLTATINGSGDIHLGQITARRVQVTVNGSGDLECNNITAQSVDGSVNGSGDLQMNGNCETANYALVGSGDISAAGLKAKQVTAKVHGTGDIHCHAAESIVMTQRRHGNSITYTGNPTQVVQNEE